MVGRVLCATSLSLQGVNVWYFLSRVCPPCQALVSVSQILCLRGHVVPSLKGKKKRAQIKQTLDIDLSSLQRRVIKGWIIISLR